MSNKNNDFVQKEKVGSIAPLVCIDHNNQYKWPVFTTSVSIMTFSSPLADWMLAYSNVTEKNWKWKEIKDPPKWRWKIEWRNKGHQRRMEQYFQHAVLMWKDMGETLNCVQRVLKKTECTELWPNRERFTSVWKAKAWSVKSSDRTVVNLWWVGSWSYATAQLIRPPISRARRITCHHRLWLQLSITINFSFLHPSFTPSRSLVRI